MRQAGSAGRALSDPPDPRVSALRDRRLLILLAATALLFAIYALPLPAPLEQIGRAHV